MARNTISTLAFKRDRLVAKLDLSKALRQGKTVAYGQLPTDISNDTTIDVTKQSLRLVIPQDGWSMTTSQGTGTITNVEELDAVFRITYNGPGATQDAGSFVVITSTADITALSFRPRNEYDIGLLPTVPGINSNDPADIVNNPNIGGLQPGRPWIEGPPIPLIPIFSGVATGGTTTTETIDDIVYKIHTFNSDDNFVCDSEIPYLEYLLVAGGGSGGTSQSSSGGGGGAGGVLRNIGDGIVLPTGTYPVVIGLGGAEITFSSAPGNDGTASTFNNLTAVGGGRGGRGGLPTFNGGNGGSGGGGGVVTINGIGVPGSGTAGQGSDGGSPFSDPTAANTGGGGGGGAGEVGGDAALATGGKGGDGVELNFDGTSRYYGGGGGGAGDTGQSGAGGLGGGSAGVRDGTSVAGTDGLGGGSGGNRGSGGTGKGGDGVVKIRYRVA